MYNCSAIILAGGQSSRMGQDKACMTIDGTKMLTSVIDQIEPITDDIIISTNKIEHEVFQKTLVFDLFKNKGPLAGIHEGLIQSKHEYCLVLSCDIPFIKEAILKRLLDEHLTNDAAITIASCNGKTHPLCGVYQTKTAKALKELLVTNIHKMHTALNYFNVKVLDFPIEDEPFFRNLNTPNDINLNI